MATLKMLDKGECERWLASNLEHVRAMAAAEPELRIYVPVLGSGEIGSALLLPAMASLIPHQDPATAIAVTFMSLGSKRNEESSFLILNVEREAPA